MVTVVRARPLPRVPVSVLRSSLIDLLLSLADSFEWSTIQTYDKRR